MLSVIFDIWLFIIRHYWRWELFTLFWKPHSWTKLSQLIHLGTRSAGMIHDIGNTTMIIRFLHAEFASQLTNRQNRELTAQLENLSAQITEGQPYLIQKRNSIIFNVDECLQEGVALFHNHPLARSCTVHINIFENFEVCGSPTILIQAILNILQNSAESLNSQEYREIEISLKRKKYAGVLSIRDNGPGFPKNHRVKMLLSNKQNGRGIGLWYTSIQLRIHLFCTMHLSNQKRGGAQTDLYFWKLQ